MLEIFKLHFRGAESVSKGLLYGDLADHRLASFRGITCTGEEDSLIECDLNTGSRVNKMNHVVGQYWKSINFCMNFV